MFLEDPNLAPVYKDQLPASLANFTSRRRLAVVRFSKGFNLADEKEQNSIMDELDSIFRQAGFKKVVFIGSSAFADLLIRD
jgi:hypothetical protein